MATVYVPGVALTSISGFIGGQPWACVHHWKFGSGTARWTQADLDLLANTVLSQWGINYGSLSGQNVTWSLVIASDLTDNQSLQSRSTGAAGAGSRIGNHDPASLSVLVRNQIQSRYRGGHPRTYYPFGVAADMSNENSWSTSLINGVQQAVHTFITGVTSAAYTSSAGLLQHVIPRYTYTVTDDPVHKKYVRERSGLINAYPVLTYQTLVAISSQRRRMTT